MAGNKNSKRQIYLVCVLFLNICTSTAGARSALHKKIQYHLLELNNALQELGESNTHFINKRSVLNHDEIIYNSLMVFCNEMNSGGGLWSSNARKPNQTDVSSSTSTNNTSKYSLKSLAIPNHRKIPDTSPLIIWPQMFPRKVQAERDGNDLWLVFDVIHTAPVNVTRYLSFDTTNVIIDYPDKFTASSSSLQVSPIMSKGRLRIDASQCVNVSIPSRSQAAFISFELVGKKEYFAEMELDLCMFDYFLNETVAYENRVWEKKKEKIFTENLSPPYLNITPPDLGHEILIKKGQNSVFYLDTELRRYESSLSIQVWIWDRSKGRKRIKSEFHFNYNGDTIQTPVTDDLISIEILEQYKMESSQRFGHENHTDSPSLNEEDKLRLKIKITINVSNGKRSGKLLIRYSEDFDDRKLVQRFSFYRIYDLKLRNRPTIFPKNQIDGFSVFKNALFKCDKDGIMHYPKIGKNCTLQCYAFGTDIKDIFISDTNSRRSLIVNSVSRVVRDGTSAFAMIDLGPASKDIEGTYRCTAITSNGKQRRQDVKLFTSLFTEVNDSDIKVKEFTNGTTKITCTAFGVQPLNMSISVQKDNEEHERVDNKSSNSRSISINGNISTLTLLLSTDQLRYPSTYLYCEADGERGRSTGAILLEDKISYHKN